MNVWIGHPDFFLVTFSISNHIEWLVVSGGVLEWNGYLFEARCGLAYSPADATATHCLLLQ